MHRREPEQAKLRKRFFLELGEHGLGPPLHQVHVAEEVARQPTLGAISNICGSAASASSSRPT
jgi:hypothetical protein